MGRPKSTGPTAIELELLTILRRLGEATLREVHDVISATRRISSQRVSKCLFTMVEKGLVQIIDQRRPAKFKATDAKEATFDGILSKAESQLASRSPRRFISYMLKRFKMSAEDRRKIREELDKMG